MKKPVVKVLPLWASKDQHVGHVVSTVSKNDSQLSPFLLGPCKLYGHHVSKNMENAWQFSKVYEGYFHPNGYPRKRWWTWARTGWSNPRAIRYPMGKGAVPLCSWWDGEALDYIQARKVIYGPLYAKLVKKTVIYKHLHHLFLKGKSITLLDYDAYDHAALGMSLTDVLNNPNKKMGHAFVLAMLLQKDPALKQMRL